MNILSFLNRKIEVDTSFKTENLSIVFLGYRDFMQSTVQNLLFRLETTGRQNEIIFVTNRNNNKEVDSFCMNYAGYFSTDLISTNKTKNIDIANNNIIVFNNSMFSTYLSSHFTDFFGNNLSDKKAYVFTTSFSNNRAKITLSNLKTNQFKKNIYLDNLALESTLNNKDINLLNYPIVESKVFNTFNSIITENLDVQQTIEVVDFDTLISENTFKFKEISRVEKYFNNYNGNVDILLGELLESSFDVFETLKVEKEENKVIGDNNKTENFINLVADIIDIYTNNYSRVIDNFKSEFKVYELNKELYADKIKSKQEVARVFTERLNNLNDLKSVILSNKTNGQISFDEIVEIMNIIESIVKAT